MQVSLTKPRCDEHVVCISEAERRQAMGTKHYCEASWDPFLPSLGNV